MIARPHQLVFDLPPRTARGRDDFLVAPANEIALRMIGAPQAWHGAKLALVGPEASGKTHLAHVWADTAGAQVIAARDLPSTFPHNNWPATPLVIEDADAMGGDPRAEEALFHLFNAATERAQQVLITGRESPSVWPIRLPDLLSRLAALGVARLNPPDDQLLGAVMMKQFLDRQVAIDPEAIAYLVPRIERSFAAAARMVAALDTEALARGSTVTRPLAREVLHARNPLSDDPTGAR